MELVEVIKKRRSIRRYKPDEIPKEDIYDIVRAAYLVPVPTINRCGVL